MIRRVLSASLATVAGAVSLVALTVAANSGMQVAGISGISGGAIGAIKAAVDAGAGPDEIAELGRSQGFDVVVSS